MHLIVEKIKKKVKKSGTKNERVNIITEKNKAKLQKIKRGNIVKIIAIIILDQIHAALYCDCSKENFIFTFCPIPMAPRYR